MEGVIGYIWPRLEKEIAQAMKQHEESRPQHSAHLPKPNADGSRPQLLVPQSDPDSYNTTSLHPQQPTLSIQLILTRWSILSFLDSVFPAGLSI
ncbi:hypothetical protein GX51_08213 [Blastomyces parvus]|uniref:Uncharacterized protein n=1 Tax=Blastomyces parvus TaxID=2060905 RepID=A0A2B7WG44_9EURO|nr:hypothetical protein GX51_08213 [Blastomyces parvus]